jgi:hypothetical protein
MWESFVRRGFAINTEAVELVTAGTRDVVVLGQSRV